MANARLYALRAQLQAERAGETSSAETVVCPGHHPLLRSGPGLAARRRSGDWLAREAQVAVLTDAVSPTYLCSPRHLRRLLKWGNGRFWTLQEDKIGAWRRIWLRSQAKVADALGVEAIGARSRQETDWQRGRAAFTLGSARAAGATLPRLALAQSILWSALSPSLAGGETVPLTPPIGRPALA